MSIFDELEAQYNEIDNEYAAIEFEAMSKGWTKKEGKYRRKRELNDQAYFLFIKTGRQDQRGERKTDNQKADLDIVMEAEIGMGYSAEFRQRRTSF